MGFILKAAVWCLLLIPENEHWDLDPNGFHLFIYSCLSSFSISPSCSCLTVCFCVCSICSSCTISSPLSLQAESCAFPAQTPPPDPAQDGSASTAVAPHRVVEVAIPHVGTFVIQSREGGYDDEVAPIPAGVCVWCGLFQRRLAAASLTACLSASQCAKIVCLDQLCCLLANLTRFLSLKTLSLFIPNTNRIVRIRMQN